MLNRRLPKRLFRSHDPQRRRRDIERQLRSQSTRRPYFERLEDRIVLSATLVRDINTYPEGRGASQITAVGNTAYFTHYSRLHGEELWRSDGTEAGTFLVKDIWAGATGSSARFLTNVNGTLYFTAQGSSSGFELWKSDGTEVGTVMVKDIRPGSAWSYPQRLTNIGGTLYFWADDGESGKELWKSDGTESGTVRVKNINPDGDSSPFTSLVDVSGTLFFGVDEGANGRKLWKSDGTEAGTVRVKDLNPSGYAAIYELTNLNGTLFFRANDGINGTELWKSDGTEEGTVLVKDIQPGSSGSGPTYLRNIGGTLYFRADDGADGGSNSELWKSDGTAAGTVRVKDIWPGYRKSSFPRMLMNSGGVLFFTAEDGTNGRELWKSDGTDGGTVLVKNIHPSDTSSPNYLTSVNGELYFIADDGTSGSELWRSDGSSAGTVLVKDIRTGSDSADARGLVNVNGKLFFTANDGLVGTQLWKSEGQASDTLITRLFDDTRSSDVSWLRNVNGTLYFSASAWSTTDGFSGQEPWKSDGTPSGTVLVKDIRGGNFASSDPSSFNAVGQSVFFIANDGTTGSELWKTDGTEGGTTLVKDIQPANASVLPSSLVNVNGTLFFAANDGTSGSELWKSDGTPSGTSLVKDIRPGSDPSSPRVAMNFNGLLLFQADDGSHGSELWKSDGTEAGTALVKDINPNGGSQPEALVVAGGRLFFEARSSNSGTELWKSDGTEQGTVLVKDIRPGSSSSYPKFMTDVGGTLFFIADDGTSGWELWKSDGTEAGTVRVKDIRPSGSQLVHRYLTNVNGTLYFLANDGTSGYELWRSDGTESGTVLVKEIRPGSEGSGARYLTNVNGTLFFQANDGTTGAELWRSDGTGEGTVLVKDIEPGVFSSNPRQLTNVNGRLFFSASDRFGVELWTAEALTPLPRLTLSAASQSVSEGSGTALVTATLDSPAAETITVPVTIVGLEATEGIDYQTAANAFTFLAGESVATLTVGVVNDNAYETDERLRLSLTPGSAYQLGATTDHVITIIDDDPVPQVSFVRSGRSAEEGNSVVVEARLSSASHQEVTLPLTLSGNAEAGSDYRIVGGQTTITIEPGKVAGSVTLEIIDDSLAEPAESIILGFGNPTNAVLSTDPNLFRQHVVTIAQNDAPRLSFRTSQRRVAENGGTVLTMVELSQASPLPVTIPFWVAGTSSASERIVNHSAPYQIVIPPNELSGYLSVTIIDDQFVETGPDETVVFRLGTPVNAVLGTISTHTLAIQDNDIPSIEFTDLGQSIWEDIKSVTITVSTTRLSTEPIIVPIKISGLGSSLPVGYASVGDDFSVSTSDLVIPAGAWSTSRSVSIINDKATEVSEQVVIGLLPPNIGQLGKQQQHTITIRDNDPLVTVSRSTASVTESNTGVYFDISLSAITNTPVVVPYAFGGTATSGVDYTVGSAKSITISAGNLSARVNVSVKDDTRDEPNETISLTISAPTSGGASLIRTTSATITINDNDSPPTLSWGIVEESKWSLSRGRYWAEATDNPVLTESTRTYRYNVNLSQASAYDVFATIGLGGSTKLNSDYSISGLDTKNRLKIPAGATSASFTIAVKDDTTQESTENIVLTLTSATNANLPSSSASRKRTVEIRDNDVPPAPPEPLPNRSPGTLAIDTSGGIFHLPAAGGYSNAAVSSGLVSDIACGIGQICLLIGGKGFIDGATAFFDANFNGVADFFDADANGIQDDGEPVEPSVRTQLDGAFALTIPSEFDQDEDELVSPQEGRWVLAGGIDSAIDLPLRLRMTAPIEGFVITPLSTIVERLITNGGMGYATAEERVKAAMGITGVDLARTNPLYGAVYGDMNGAVAETASTKLYATALLVADLFAGVPGAPSVAFLGEVVFSDIADKLKAPDALLDLSYEGVVASVIDGVSSVTGLLLDADPVKHQEIVSGAAKVIAAGNQAIDELPIGPSLTYLTSLFRVKKVMLGQAAPALRAVTEQGDAMGSVIDEFTGSNLQGKVVVASVGTITPPVIMIRSGSITEGDSGTRTLELAVSLIGEHSQAVSVDYQSEDGTARESVDYTSVSGSLAWAAGDNTSRVISIPIHGNTSFEPDKYATVVLGNATGAVIRASRGYGFILNDDAFGHLASAAPQVTRTEFLLSFQDNDFNLTENGQGVSGGSIVNPTVINLVGRDAADDTLLLDFTERYQGSRTIRFDGGDAGVDTVNVLGGEFARIRQTLTNATDGVTTFTPTQGDSTAVLEWKGLEPFLLNVGSVTDLIFELPADVNDAILEDADPTDQSYAGMMWLRSESGRFETTIFKNPTGSITIRSSGQQADFVRLLDYDPGFTGTVHVESGFTPNPAIRVGLDNGNLSVAFNGNANPRVAIAYDASQNAYLISSTNDTLLAGSGAVQVSPDTVRVEGATVNGFSITGGTGNDELTLDFTTGNPIPAGGLSYDAAGGEDSVRVFGTGTQNPNLVHDATAARSGVITLAQGRVEFAGLNALDFVNVGELTIQTSRGGNALGVSAGQLGDGTTPAVVISGTSGGSLLPETRIRSSSIAIDTRSVPGFDQVTVNGANNAHGNRGLSIFSGGQAGDAILIVGDVLVDGPVTLDAPSITLAARLATTGGQAAGNVNFSGAVTVTSRASVETDGQAADGTVRFGGNLALEADLTVTTGDGNVSFVGTVNGAFELGIDSQGRTEFSQEVGDVDPLGRLTTDAGGVTISKGAVTVSSQTYGDAVALEGVLVTIAGSISIIGSVALLSDSGVTANGGAIAIGGPVTGYHDLVISALGSTTFGHAVNVRSLGVTTDTFSAGELTTQEGLSIVNRGEGTISGAVSMGTVSLTKGGAGTLSLGGPVNYYVPSNILQGTLKLAGTDADDRIIADQLMNGTTASWTLSIDGRPFFAGAFSDGSLFAIDGIGGNDTLDIAGRPTNDSFLLDGRRVVINGGPLETSGIESIGIAGGSGDDVLRVATIIGGPSLHFGGGTGSDRIETLDGANTWVIGLANGGSLNTAVSFDSVETVVGGLGNDVFVFGAAGQLSGQVLGGGGDDTLDLSAKATSQTVNLANRTASSIGGFAAIGRFIGSQHANDSIIGPDSVNTWSIGAANAGMINSLFAFSGFENLTGGPTNDTFRFGESGTLMGRLAGGSGVDQIDLSAALGTLEFRIGTVPSVTDVIGGYSSIEEVIGNSLPTSRLHGPNATSVWTIDASGQVVVSRMIYRGIRTIVGGTGTDTVNGPSVETLWAINGQNRGLLTFGAITIAFEGVENLRGGTVVNDFHVAPAGSLTGNLHGGGGAAIHSLSYSQWAMGVTVNLALSTAANATAVAGITSGFRMVTGGSGGDVLTGNVSLSSILVGLGGDDRLTGGSMRDLLFGGTGKDTLLGGAGDDLLTAGATAFDRNRTAILQILAEWTSARSFAERTSNVSGTGTGPRSNGTTFLNSTANDEIVDTVFADDDDDLLSGELGQDWFFALASEITDLVSAGAGTERRDTPAPE